MDSETEISKIHLCRTRYCQKLVFPFHLYKDAVNTVGTAEPCVSHRKQRSTAMGLFRNLAFSKVHAAEDPPRLEVSSPANNEVVPTEIFESLVRAYIDKESGMDRVYMLFQKNHKGESSSEMFLMKLALMQTLFISFFIAYVPEWRQAKEEFISQHRGTVFRTRIQALRLMQDTVSLRACKAGAIFSMKITSFSALFIFVSQVIASYRNKSSVLEYTLAASLAGGLNRLNLGLKGFVSGSVIGAVLGSVVGCISWGFLSAVNMKQDQRHFEDVMSKLKVERYLVGDEAFKAKVSEAKGSILTSTPPVEILSPPAS